jgi:hypothetical protein
MGRDHKGQGCGVDQKKKYQGNIARAALMRPTKKDLHSAILRPGAL